MPKAKTTTKKSSGLKLGSKMKFDKTLMLVIIGVTVSVFGFLIYQRSQAASYPPYSWAYFKEVNFTTSDGVKSNGDGIRGYCSPVKVKSAYGILVRCGQRKTVWTSGATSQYQYRNIIFNVSANKYLPDGDWMSFTATGAKGSSGGLSTNPYRTCKNTGLAFADVGYVITTYGTVRYGQEFRWTGSKWQARFSSMGYDTCSSTTGWMDYAGTW